MIYTATEEDRKHFCTYDQAYAAIVDDLPFRSNGHKHAARNLSTGHCIPCADAFIAFGYVAGSTRLFPQWKFVIEMGEETVGPFKAHPRFAERMANPNWQRDEEIQREAAAYRAQLELEADAARDEYLARGVLASED